MGAMGGAKGVVHIDVSDPGEFFGEHRVIGLFLVVIADILQQHDVARFHHADGLLDLFANAIVHEGHGATEEVGEFGGDRAQGHRGLALALGPAKVSGEDDLAALLDEQPQGGQGFNNSSRVGDDHLAILLFERHVVIHPGKDAFALNLQVSDSQFCHKIILPKLSGRGYLRARESQRDFARDCRSFLYSQDGLRLQGAR
jgi:hypothetical protein